MTAPAALAQADALYREHRFHAARRVCEQALAASPDDPALLSRLGQCLLRLKLHSRGERAIRRAIELDPSSRQNYHALALALRELDRLDEAIAIADDALRRFPSDVVIRAFRAELLRYARRTQEAYDELLPLIRKGGTIHAAVTVAFARICADLKRHAEGIPPLEASLSIPSIPPVLRNECLHVLGDCHDALADYDRAFAAYDEANRIFPSPFDPAAHTRNIDRVISGWTRPALARLPRASSALARSALPVFIVGMPRSGTTLTEQILDRHDDFLGAGELLYVHEIAGRIEAGLPPRYPADEDPPAPAGFLHARDRLTPAITDEAGEAYIERLRTHIPGGRPEPLRISNKQPLAFHHLGLISRILPGARIIHCRRDPLDTCLSCYFNRFTGGNPTTNLAHLGLTYRAYQRLMHHWRSILDIPMLDIDYEALVADQEGTTRRIIEFLGLDWARGGEACLNFQSSARIAHTPSLSQVRQPMYTRSVGRWKHYEKHIGPLRKALQG